MNKSDRQLDISEKGVGRGQAVSKVSSLWAGETMTLSAEMGHWKRSLIAGRTSLTSLTAFGAQILKLFILFFNCT
jgi:hypothetical protein